MTVRNVQNMKYTLKGTVNMKLQVGETVKLNEVPHVPQVVNSILIVSRLISKGTTVGDTKDKITIKKNGINVIQDTRKRDK